MVASVVAAAVGNCFVLDIGLVDVGRLAVVAVGMLVAGIVVAPAGHIVVAVWAAVGPADIVAAVRIGHAVAGAAYCFAGNCFAVAAREERRSSSPI